MKQVVVGREATDSDKVPIVVEGGVLENVEEFPYLGHACCVCVHKQLYICQQRYVYCVHMCTRMQIASYIGQRSVTHCHIIMQSIIV